MKQTKRRWLHDPGQDPQAFSSFHAAANNVGASIQVCCSHGYTPVSSSSRVMFLRVDHFSEGTEVQGALSASARGESRQLAMRERRMATG